jgi:hypothetical protein
VRNENPAADVSLPTLALISGSCACGIKIGGDKSRCQPIRQTQRHVDHPATCHLPVPCRNKGTALTVHFEQTVAHQEQVAPTLWSRSSPHFPMASGQRGSVSGSGFAHVRLLRLDISSLARGFFLAFDRDHPTRSRVERDLPVLTGTLADRERAGSLRGQRE